MTKEDIRAAIEYGRYDYVEEAGMGIKYIEAYGQKIAIDPVAKTATYCVTFHVTDYALREVEHRMLEHRINVAKSELVALEIQLNELDKED